MKKYYKVVRTHRGRLFSAALMWKYSKSLIVEYFESKWVCAPDQVKETNGLTCFSSINFAKNFVSQKLWLRGLSKPEIWECRVGKLYKKLPTRRNRINIENVKLDYIRLVDPVDWPTGTVMTDKIKLIRRIK